MAVVGYGKAEKRQVMDMTKRLLHLAALPRPDDAAEGRVLIGRARDARKVQGAGVVPFGRQAVGVGKLRVRES